MKKGLGTAIFLLILVTNIAEVSAYNGNANLSNGVIVVLFIPIMLGIIYLASKEVK